MERWAATRDVLEDQADRDLRNFGCLQPQLVAFEGDELLFVAEIRPSLAGVDPESLIELVVLAFPLGADRIALSLPGRAWSLEDPIPPVLQDGGDLRPQVQALLLVDGHGDEVRVASVIRPYELAGDVPVWREPFETAEVPDSWAVTLMLLGLRKRHKYRDAAAAELRRQAAYCESLGHRLRIGASGMVRLFADRFDEELRRLTEQPLS